MTAPTGRFTAQQWRKIYLGIALGLVVIAVALAIIKPSEAIVVGVLMGAALVCPIGSLLGYLRDRPHVWLHLVMLVVLMFEAMVLAGVVNGMNS